MKKLLSLLLVFMFVLSIHFSMPIKASAITVTEIQTKLDALIEKYPAESYNPTKECYYFVQLLTQEIFGHGLPQQPKDTLYKYCFTDSYKENYIQVGNTLTQKDGTLSEDNLKNLFSLAQPGDVIQMDYTHDGEDSLHVMMVYSASSEGIVLYHAGAYKLRNGKYSYGKIYLGSSSGTDKLYGFSKAPLKYSDFKSYLYSPDDGISLYRSKKAEVTTEKSEQYTFNTVDGGTEHSFSSKYDMTVSIFGRDVCVNTDVVIDGLIKSGVNKQKNIRLLFIDCDKKTKDQVKAFANKYPNSNIAFCYDTSDGARTAMWEFARKAGFSGSITTPLTVFTKSDGTIFKIKQGVLEPNYLYQLANGDLSGEEIVTLEISGEENYTYAFDVLNRLNELRSELKLNTLVMDKNLMSAAMKRAGELSIYYSHTRPNGENSLSILDDSHTFTAENIAIGQSRPKDVMNSWENSTGHYKNMTNSNFSSVGIGCFKTSEGHLCWVQLFSSSDSSASSTTGVSVVNHNIETQVRFLNLGFYTGENLHFIKAGKQTKISVWNANKGFLDLKQTINSSLFNFTSSNNSVVIVDSNGNCTIKGEGPCAITVSLKENASFKPTTDYVVGHVYSNGSDTSCDFCGDIRRIENNSSSSENSATYSKPSSAVSQKPSSLQEKPLNSTSKQNGSTSSKLASSQAISSVIEQNNSVSSKTTSSFTENQNIKENSNASDLVSSVLTSHDEDTSDVIFSTQENDYDSINKEQIVLAEINDVCITGFGDEFSENTTINIESITDNNAIKHVENHLGKEYINYAIYEINASSQPNSSVTAIFDMPEGLNPEKAIVIFVSEDGEIEELPCVVDKENMQIRAQLSHFSTYVVAEKNTLKSFNILWIIIPFVISLFVAVLIFIKKRKKYENF